MGGKCTPTGGSLSTVAPPGATKPGKAALAAPTLVAAPPNTGVTVEAALIEVTVAELVPAPPISAGPADGVPARGFPVLPRPDPVASYEGISPGFTPAPVSPDSTESGKLVPFVSKPPPTPPTPEVPLEGPPSVSMEIPPGPLTTTPGKAAPPGRSIMKPGSNAVPAVPVLPAMCPCTLELIEVAAAVYL